MSDNALNYENDARNNVEQGRSNLINQLNVTAGVASTVSSANNQAAALSVPQGYSSGRSPVPWTRSGAMKRLPR